MENPKETWLVNGNSSIGVLKLFIDEIYYTIDGSLLMSGTLF